MLNSRKRKSIENIGSAFIIPENEYGEYIKQNIPPSIIYVINNIETIQNTDENSLILENLHKNIEYNLDIIKDPTKVEFYEYVLDELDTMLFLHENSHYNYHNIFTNESYTKICIINKDNTE